MNSLKVIPYDETYVYIESDDDGLLWDLKSHFTFYVNGYYHMPKYKKRLWDGTIKLFSPYKKLLYRGLINELKLFCESMGYQYTIDRSLTIRNDISKDELDSFLNSLNLHSDGEKIEPREHQLYGFVSAIRNKRNTIISPTASGKSLTIYMILRWLQSKLNKKLLVVVPTTSLVEQMYKDFDDYASNTDWFSSDHVHKIYQGQKRNTDKQIVVSTWQSLYKLSEEYFGQFGAILVDETHLLSAESLKGILEKAKTCQYRIGLTGTLDGSVANELVIQGLLGPKLVVTTTKEQQEKGLISDLKVEIIQLQYTDEEKKENTKRSYQEEINWLLSSEKRNNFLVNLGNHTKGNTLMLFLKVEHGKQLYEQLRKDNKKKVYLVYGKIDAKERERIRGLTEKLDDVIIVASYGVYSTGINIRKLHNIIFCSPSKSKIRVLQSVGRGLRLHETKDKALLYDIVDDLSHRKKINYTLNHFLERFKYYAKEEFDYSITKLRI